MIVLRQLCPDDGSDIYQMLQEIPADENGFINEAFGKTLEEYQSWLTRADAASRQEGILDGWKVAQTIYWLYADGVPVGMGKLRHQLTDRLLAEGGSLGYAIRPGFRGLGYGSALLRALLEKAWEMGQERVLLTIRAHNLSSVRVAEKCGGITEKEDNLRRYIWIDRPERT
jgi:predicted acetyltransferase